MADDINLDDELDSDHIPHDSFMNAAAQVANDISDQSSLLGQGHTNPTPNMIEQGLIPRTSDSDLLRSMKEIPPEVLGKIPMFQGNPDLLAYVRGMGQNPDATPEQGPLPALEATIPPEIPGLQGGVPFNQYAGAQRNLATIPAATQQSSSSRTPIISNRNSSSLEDRLAQMNQPMVDAQKAQALNTLFAGMQHGAEDIAAGIGRQAPMHDVSDLLMKTAALPVEFQKDAQKDVIQNLDILKAKSEMNDDIAKSDPNSAISQIARNALQRAMPGMNVPPDMTAHSIEKFSTLTTLIESENRLQAIKIQREENRADRELKRQQLLDEKNKDAVAKVQSQVTTNTKGLEDQLSRISVAQANLPALLTNQNAYPVVAQEIAQAIKSGSVRANDLTAKTYLGRQDVMGKLADWASLATQGKLRAQDVQNIGDLLDTIKSGTVNQLNQRVDEGANNLAHARGLDIDKARSNFTYRDPNTGMPLNGSQYHTLQTGVTIQNTETGQSIKVPADKVDEILQDPKYKRVD